MLIHAVVPVSQANGPGERFVIWTQGCSRRCPGCFNPMAWEPRKSAGFPAELTTGQIISLIPADKVSGITVSGGEPFEQPEELRLLLAAAHSLGLNTCVYSGCTYEELRRSAPGALREVDILIDGPFLQDVPRTNAWAGSGNQRVLCLQDGEVIFGDAFFSSSPLQRPVGPQGEIFIDKAGRVTVTGSFALNLQ